MRVTAGLRPWEVVPLSSVRYAEARLRWDDGRDRRSGYTSKTCSRCGLLGYANDIASSVVRVDSAHTPIGRGQEHPHSLCAVPTYAATLDVRRDVS